MCFQIKSQSNGLSPQQNQEIIMPSHQIKNSQLSNGGIRSNNKNSSQSCSTGLIPNGRQHTNSESNEKYQEINNKSPESVDKIFQMPTTAKPFKVPILNEQPQPKPRSNPKKMEPPSTSTNDGGKDVESILKMMTSALEPLTKIAATPRTEIEVQQNKSHVYANLPPPFFKAPTKNTSKH